MQSKSPNLKDFLVDDTTNHFDHKIIAKVSYHEQQAVKCMGLLVRILEFLHCCTVVPDGTLQKQQILIQMVLNDSFGLH